MKYFLLLLAVAVVGASIVGFEMGGDAVNMGIGCALVAPFLASAAATLWWADR